MPTLTDEMAHAIIRLRKKQGRIRKLDTLKEIFRHFGIIGKDYDKVRNYLTLDDSNYITINSIVFFRKNKKFI